MLLEIIFVAVFIVVLWLIGSAHWVLQMVAWFAMLYIGQTLYEWRERRRRDYQYWYGE